MDLQYSGGIHAESLYTDAYYTAVFLLSVPGSDQMSHWTDHGKKGNLDSQYCGKDRGSIRSFGKRYSEESITSSQSGGQDV